MFEWLQHILGLTNLLLKVCIAVEIDVISIITELDDWFVGLAEIIMFSDLVTNGLAEIQDGVTDVLRETQVSVCSIYTGKFFSSLILHCQGTTFMEIVSLHLPLSLSLSLPPFLSLCYPFLSPPLLFSPTLSLPSSLSFPPSSWLPPLMQAHIDTEN